MKKKISAAIIFTLLIPCGLWAASTLQKSAEWPFSPPSLFLKGGVNAVTAGSGLIFWAVGDTVEIIDKAAFSNLSSINIRTSTAIQDVLFDETRKLLFVAAGYDSRDQSGGLQIFDLTNPSLPVFTGIFEKSDDNPGYTVKDGTSAAVPDVDARGLGLNGNTLFLADDNFGLRVIDVEDLSNLQEIPLETQGPDRTSGYKQPDIYGNFKATGGYIGLSLHSFNGRVYAFVLDFFHGIRVFDVTYPDVIADPVSKDTRTNFWYGSLSLLTDIFVTETEGNLTAFVTGGDATGSSFVLSRLDVSFNDDDDMLITNSGRHLTNGEARSLAVSGNYAYIADGPLGLTVVDIVNGTLNNGDEVYTYNKVGSYTQMADYAYNVFLDGTALYLATGESGLNKLNVSNPEAPVFLNRMDHIVKGDDVAVSGNHTFMLDRKKGLRIFDTTEPEYPILQSFLPISGESSDLAVSNAYAFIAKKSGSISVISVSDKTTPVMTDTTIASPSPEKLFVSGRYLFIADSTSGMRIVDITDPIVPVTISTTGTTGSAEAVFVHGNIAYVAEGSSGVEIFNVINPEAPLKITSSSMTEARDVCVLVKGSSTYMLVADGTAGLKVVDVSNMDSPLPEPATLSTIRTGTDTTSAFTAVSVASLGTNAYVSAGNSGLLVVDLTDPLRPAAAIHKQSASFIRESIPSAKGKTQYVTVAEGGLGLRIYYLSAASDNDNGNEIFVPTVDKGCFIDSVF